MIYDERRLLDLLQMGGGSDPEGVLSEVMEVLSNATFYEKHERPIARFGSGAADVRPKALAHHLLRYSKSHGPTTTVAALNALFEAESVATVTYAYVENVATDVVVDLGEGVTALPEGAAPNKEFAARSTE